MKFTIATLVTLMAVPAAAIELTPDNYINVVTGKVVFIKMFAPWCGHCKAMAPDWNKLMDEYADSETKLIADVDCTAEGKPICDNNAVQGFPTLKYGDPYDLEDYEGERTYDELKKFIDEKLKPKCSPVNIDLCDDDQKKEIEALLALSQADITAKLQAEEAKIAESNKIFEAAVEKLQAEYQKLMEEKEEEEKTIKAGGLGMMKSVMATQIFRRSKNDEL